MVKNMVMESKQLLMVGNMKDNLKMIFIKEKESIQKKIKNNIIKADTDKALITFIILNLCAKK